MRRNDEYSSAVNPPDCLVAMVALKLVSARGKPGRYLSETSEKTTVPAAPG